MKFGLTLPNRGVLFDVTTPEQMLRMSEIADQSDVFQSVWVGDSLLGKPRMEAVALLSGIAARTSRVRLGPACMASIALRDPVLLAYQWGSLDLLAQGRTIMVACTGIITQEGGKVEGALYGVTARDRVRRLIEWIEILKLLWTQDNVSYDGEYYKFSNVTVSPKPAAKPRPPIWIASNARGNREVIEQSHRRVARRAEGWQTSLSEPDDVRWRVEDIRQKAREMGRDPNEIEMHLYHNINVNEDRQAALEESKRFLDIYYEENMPKERVQTWTAAGSPDDCVKHLQVFKEMGFNEVTLRMTGWDQFGQMERVINEVLPRLMD